MTEDEALCRFTLHPAPEQLPELRALLRAETSKERASQGRGDTELMKLLCVCLFHEGSLEDTLLVFDAKSASMDANASIDIQLLCGRGLAETKAYLRDHPDERARIAIARISMHEAAGDFDGFTARRRAEEHARYYGVGGGWA
jgi:hypothetical protein